MPAITVAVVIPTLNEAPALRSLLPTLTGLAEEILVADGGSADDTCRIAFDLGAHCVSGTRGRGPQMNLGAAATSADVLVFLHADTRLPAGALTAVRERIAQGCVGGGFLARFDDRRALMRLGSQLINLRTRLTRIPLGDQVQFARRDVFDSLGGFREWPILEDLDFMLRLRRRGPVAIIARPVETSARRYVKNGILRTTLNNWWIWTLFLLGVPPERLAARYRQVR